MLGIFLDSETNGLDPSKHKILEIAYKILNVETGSLIDTFQSVIKISTNDWELSDKESLKVNQITWEEVSKGEEPALVSGKIMQNFEKHNIKRGNAVFICQNPSFDRAFFSRLISPLIQEEKKWPYHWLDLASMFWATSIREEKEGKAPFPWITGYSKDSIATYYNLGSEKKPHRAMNGVDHLITCYEAVVGFPSAVVNNSSSL